MRVYLARHGEALVEGDDSERVLTATGREKVRVIGEALAKRQVKPSDIISSPLPRALQTAELLAATLSFEGPVHTDKRLLADVSPRVTARFVHELRDQTLLVAHEPLCSTLTALLLLKPTFPAFLRAQVVCLDLSPRQWLWTVDPTTLVSPENV